MSESARAGWIVCDADGLELEVGSTVYRGDLGDEEFVGEVAAITRNASGAFGLSIRYKVAGADVFRCWIDPATVRRVEVVE